MKKVAMTALRASDLGGCLVTLFLRGGAFCGFVTLLTMNAPALCRAFATLFAACLMAAVVAWALKAISAELMTLLGFSEVQLEHDELVRMGL